MELKRMLSNRLTVICLSTLIAALLFVQRESKGEDIMQLGRRLSDIIEGNGHKDLFPLDSSDMWGTIFVILGLLVAASGGIGGGGILVPLLILVFGFSPKHAIPLSNFTILGSSITNMALNVPKRHPLANRPLVDWDLILVMEPLTMAGAIVGAFITKVLPDWILVVSLVILLAFTTWKTLKKGFSQFKKESKYFEDMKKSELSKALEKHEEEDQTKGLLEDDKIAHELLEEKEPLDPALEKLLQDESVTPVDKVIIMTVMVLVVIVLNMVKGGGGSFPSPIGIQCGSSGYWLLTALVFIWVISISLWMRSILIDKWKLKKELKYKYVEGDVEWNPRSTIIYPCICFFAGFFAGLFGVGGGIVKGPLMLQMEINPLVASGTVAVMIMYTSVAATTMFIAFGTLTWDYAWYLFVIGLLATAVGQIGVGFLVKKYKRVSLVSLSIGAVVALSTILMAIQSVFSLTDAETSNSSSSLCGKS